MAHTHTHTCAEMSFSIERLMSSTLPPLATMALASALPMPELPPTTMTRVGGAPSTPASATKHTPSSPIAAPRCRRIGVALDWWARILGF